MTVAQNKIQLAQKLFQTKDKRILKAIESILDPEEEYFELSPAQKRDLDKRLADHKAGKLSYYTIEEVRKAALKAIKK
jgi:putative addiction module component (TIGR02574 family)